MFVVAHMGYWSSSVMYANVSHRNDDPTFDLAAAQYAGASISLFSVLLGWLALKPLFETFGLSTIAALTGWFLIGAVFVSYGLLATALYRSGYASARLAFMLVLFATVGTLAYAIIVAVLAPGLRTAESALELTVVAFLAGIPAYAALTVLRSRQVGSISSRSSPIDGISPSLGYAEGVLVLTGFLLLAVLGLA